MRCSWFSAIAKRSVMMLLIATETVGSWHPGSSPGLDAVFEVDVDLGEQGTRRVKPWSEDSRTTLGWVS